LDEAPLKIKIDGFVKRSDEQTHAVVEYIKENYLGGFDELGHKIRDSINGFTEFCKNSFDMDYIKERNQVLEGHYEEMI